MLTKQQPFHAEVKATREVEELTSYFIIVTFYDLLCFKTSALFMM